MSGIILLNRFLVAFKFCLPFDQVQDHPSLPCLFDLGLVESRASGATGICHACDEQHTIKIRIDPVTDKLGWRCPEAGFVETTSDQLKTVRFNPEAFAAWIASELNCQRRKMTPLVENLLWKVGWYEFQANDVNIYLASRIRDAEDVGVIARALRAEPSLRNGLLIAPDISNTDGLMISGCRIAAIDDVITIRDNALSTNQSRVAELAGLIFKAGPGRKQHKMRSEVSETIRQFHNDGKIFRSKRAASEAISEAMAARYPTSKVPGRTVIEDEIDVSDFGCFLVGK
ncbi:hypothetical protein OAN80_03660 [Alphaproteobacteria bacterium]|nr:hypothetical protein [Alphaproteobacteria bacterium]